MDVFQRAIVRISLYPCRVNSVPVNRDLPLENTQGAERLSGEEAFLGFLSVAFVGRPETGFSCYLMFWTASDIFVVS